MQSCNIHKRSPVKVARVGAESGRQPGVELGVLPFPGPWCPPQVEERPAESVSWAFWLKVLPAQIQVGSRKPDETTANEVLLMQTESTSRASR